MTYSATGDWLKDEGQEEGLIGMENVHKEAVVKILRIDSNKEYTLWADPTIIGLRDKAYAEMTYTGQRGDRPLLLLRWKKEQINLFEPDRYFYYAIATDLGIDPEGSIEVDKERVPDA